MDINEWILWLVGGGTLMVISSILISLVCTILPLVGLGWFLYSRHKKAVSMQQASQTWVSTPGTVIKSRVEVSGGETTTVYPRVIYEYRVGARQFQGDQIRAGEKFWSARTGRDAYDTIDRYPEGLEVTVNYSPANPAETALER